VVTNEAPPYAGSVRSAEVIAALCLATDLGMGFPFEHGLHSTLIASRVAERLGVDPATATGTYYACLLSHSGCTTDAHVTAEVFGGSLTTHFNPVMYGSRREVMGGLLRALPPPESAEPVRTLQAARRLPRMARSARPQFTAMCEVAQLLADGVGLPPSVQDLLAHLFERWDGKGPLGRAKGEDIPLPMRIVHVAVDAALQRLLGGAEQAARVIRDRAGRAFDPGVAACLSDNAREILALDAEVSVWEEVLAREPTPHLTLEGMGIDRALTAMGRFTDLISPYLSGHSIGVADFAAGPRNAVA
jgi:HD domain